MTKLATKIAIVQQQIDSLEHALVAKKDHLRQLILQARRSATNSPLAEIVETPHFRATDLALLPTAFADSHPGFGIDITAEVINAHPTDFVKHLKAQLPADHRLAPKEPVAVAIERRNVEPYTPSREELLDLGWVEPPQEKRLNGI